MLTRDYPAALEHYTTALELSHRDARIFSSRAATYHKLAQWKQSLQVSKEGVHPPHSCCQDCDASIRLDPIWMEPRLRRATALRSLDRLVEAGQEYERVVAMEEGCLEAQEGLRHCRQETGDRNISELEK